MFCMEFSHSAASRATNSNCTEFCIANGKYVWKTLYRSLRGSVLFSRFQLFRWTDSYSHYAFLANSRKWKGLWPALDFIQILEVMRCTQEIGFDLESGLVREVRPLYSVQRSVGTTYLAMQRVFSVRSRPAPTVNRNTSSVMWNSRCNKAKQQVSP